MPPWEILGMWRLDTRVEEVGETVFVDDILIPLSFFVETLLYTFCSSNQEYSTRQSFNRAIWVRGTSNECQPAVQGLDTSLIDFGVEEASCSSYRKDFL
jgi:hypothetical protein